LINKLKQNYRELATKQFLKEMLQKSEGKQDISSQLGINMKKVAVNAFTAKYEAL